MNNPNYYFRCRKNKILLRSVKKDDCKNWLIKFPYEWKINDCFWWVYNLSKKLNITHEEYNKIFPKLLLRGRILYWMNHEEFLKISSKFGLFQFFRRFTINYFKFLFGDVGENGEYTNYDLCQIEQKNKIQISYQIFC